MNADWDVRKAPQPRGPTPPRGGGLRRALTLIWALLGAALLQYAAVGGLLWVFGWPSLSAWALALMLGLLASAAVVALDDPPLEWDSPLEWGPPLERDVLPLGGIAPATSHAAHAEVRERPGAPSGQHSWVSARARQARHPGRVGADRAETARAHDAHARAGRHAPRQAPSVYEARERTQVEILKLERIKQLVGRLERAPAGRALTETHVAQLADLLREARIPRASPSPAIVREVDRRIAVLHPG
jgi:hypothetical protein